MRTMSRPGACLLAAAMAAIPVLFVMHNGARVRLLMGGWVRA